MFHFNNMLHLLKLEWLKLKDYVLFRIVALSYIVLLPSALMVGKKLPDMKGEAFNPIVVFFNFPTVWDWLGYIGNWLVFFMLGFMAVMIVTNEHTYRTLRQNIITGLHRREFFLSKLYFMAAASLFASLYYAFCALAIGLAHADTLYLATVFKHADLVPRFWLMCMGYMSFGLLMGVLIKRTGIALFVYLTYTFVLEPVVRWALHFRLFKDKSMLFYPLNAFEDLCPLPFFDEASAFLKQNNFELFLSPTESVVASVLYIALFLWLSYRKLERSDL